MANQTLLIILVILGAAAFFYFGCKVSCTKTTEGFQRQCLGGTCAGFQRSPVDYANKSPSGWQENPHYEALPSSRFQPLDFGPIDLWSDLRRLEYGHTDASGQEDGMFKQYTQDWEGYSQLNHMQNDEKNRGNAVNIGAYQFARTMDDLYNPKFGPKGYMNTEAQYNEPNPYFTKIYGGEFIPGKFA